MFLTMAAIPGLAAIWGLLNPRIRNVEAELPDAPKRQAAPPPPPEEESEGEEQKAAAAQA